MTSPERRLRECDHPCDVLHWDVFSRTAFASPATSSSRVVFCPCVPLNDSSPVDMDDGNSHSRIAQPRDHHEFPSWSSEPEERYVSILRPSRGDK